MRLAKRIELIFGIATGVLEIITLGVIEVLEPSGNEVAASIVGSLLFFLVPGFLVAFGSYLHAIRRKIIGLVMLLVGTLPVMIFAYMFFAVSYGYRRQVFGFIFLLPFFTALVSGIASFFSIVKAIEYRIQHRQNSSTTTKI